MLCVEDLKIVNMTKSAKETKINFGCNVKAKSGLNRSILAEGFEIFFKQLGIQTKDKRSNLFKDKFKEYAQEVYKLWLYSQC